MSSTPLSHNAVTTTTPALQWPAPLASAPSAGRRGGHLSHGGTPDGALALVAQLRELPLFKLLPDEALLMLAQRASIRRYARDDFIVRQDERDASVYVLLRGRAHVERAGENGRTVLLGMFDRGDRVGDWSLVDGEPHNASVRCTGTAEALMLRGDDVLRCQAEYDDFSDAWCRDLVRLLRARNHRIMCMSLYGVRERVIWRLKDWAEENEDGRRVVSNRIGRTELARMVGASREMVCRVLRGLQSSGRIELRRDRSIVLLDDFED